MQCHKCNRGECHLIKVRAYIYNPPKILSSYEEQYWCMNCVVAEAIASKFKGKRPSDPDGMFYPHTNVC